MRPLKKPPKRNNNNNNNNNNKEKIKRKDEHEICTNTHKIEVYEDVHLDPVTVEIDQTRLNYGFPPIFVEMYYVFALHEKI